MAPEYQPHVTAFSTVLIFRASLSFFSRLSEGPMEGGGAVVGEISNVDPEEGLWAEFSESFVVMGHGAILKSCQCGLVYAARHLDLMEVSYQVLQCVRCMRGG